MVTEVSTHTLNETIFISKRGSSTVGTTALVRCSTEPATEPATLIGFRFLAATTFRLEKF